ncbi:MAG: AAA family ATPase [Ignisphaera sp.]
MSISNSMQQNLMFIKIKNYALFDDLDLELRPLTIFIGRNITGKSSLLNLMWMVLSLEPDLEKFREIMTDLGYTRIVDNIIEKAKRGMDIEKEFRELVKLALKVLPKALESNFNKRFRDPFKRYLEVFSRDRDISIEIGGGVPEESKHILRISYDRVAEIFRIGYIEPHVILEVGDRIGAKVVREIVTRSFIGVQRNYVYGFSLDVQTIEEAAIVEHKDVEKILTNTIRAITTRIMSPWLSGEDKTIYCISDRTWLIKISTRSWSRAEEYMFTYLERAFIKSYSHLIDLLYNNMIDLDVFRDVLAKIGVDEVSVKSSKEYRSLYIRLWNGLELPIEETPSSIRGIIPTLLALASKATPVVIIEDPEIHLDPSSVHALGRAIIRAVKMMNKYVIISTHNIDLLTTFVKAGKHGYDVRRESDDEILLPEVIALYLFKYDKDIKKINIKRIDILQEGLNIKELM